MQNVKTLNADSLIKQVLEARVVGLYPDGWGSTTTWSADDKGGKVREVPVKQLYGNEFRKDTQYFRKPTMKEYVGRMRKDIKKGKLKSPVLAVSHPDQRDRFVIVNGNHRLRAAKNARAETMPIDNVPWHQISLVPAGIYPEHPDIESIIYNSPRLKDFVEPDGSINMTKRRRELGVDPWSPRTSAGRGKKRRPFMSLRDYLPPFLDRLRK